MPASVSITGIGRRTKPDGEQVIYVRFSDGEEIEGTRRELRQHVRQVITDAAAIDLLKAIAISRGLRLDATSDSADDLDPLIGKTLTFTKNAAANIVRIA